MPPIGGLKAKILAAHRGNIARVLVPRENEKDLKDIPDKILSAVSVSLVEHMDVVLKESLVIDDPKSFLKGKPDKGGEGKKGKSYFPEESTSDSDIVTH